MENLEDLKIFADSRSALQIRVIGGKLKKIFIIARQKAGLFF